MKKFLIIEPQDTGFVGIQNVGIFHAEDKGQALDFAKKQWTATGRLIVYDIKEVVDGWSYYL